MGMGIALELAREGARVCIVDPSQPGQKASAAAAGILVSRGAQHALSPFRRFYLSSIAAYPAWLAGLETESGMSIPFSRSGDYLVFDRSRPSGEKAYQDKIAQLRREDAIGWQESEGLPDFVLPFGSLNTPLGDATSGNAEATASLQHASMTTLHFPQEAYVQNRILLQALAEACRRRGVQFVTGIGIADNLLITEKSRGYSVHVSGHEFQAENLLVTAGVWSETWLQALGWRSSLIPVKGQVASIPKPWAALAMVHFQEDLYLIPRQNHLVVGATTEPGNWDETFTSHGEGLLRQRLHAYLPGLKFSPIDSWAGLRPRTRDRLPLMGRLPGHGQAWICAGHYKCGISMAPLAARCMTALLRGYRSPFDIEAFDPGRKGALKPCGEKPSENFAQKYSS